MTIKRIRYSAKKAPERAIADASRKLSKPNRRIKSIRIIIGPDGVAKAKVVKKSAA